MYFYICLYPTCTPVPTQVHTLRQLTGTPLYPYTASPHHHSNKYHFICTTNISSIEEKQFLDTLKDETKSARPGISPRDTKFESYIGHTVINLSNTPLETPQIRALEKGLTFCPTTGSQINHKFGWTSNNSTED